MFLRTALLALCVQVLPADDLDLGSRVQPLPVANRFSLPGHFVWCGAPVKGPDGRYHLFYSRWPVKAGFAPGWALRSEVAYAVADGPAGPYRHVNAALPPRGNDPATGRKYWDADVTHNPNAFFHDGKYYLFYMGNHGDGKSYPMHRNHQRIGVAWASKPEGPWTRLDRPIVTVSDDKKVIFHSRKHGNRYYAVTRDVVGTFTGSKGGICLFQSDDGLDWKPAAHPKILGARFRLADGSNSISQLERPALLIENGEPTHLFGATDGYLKEGRISSNIQIPLAPAGKP